MDSHPKKKKKNQYRANQKSIHGHVVGRENQIQSIQSKSKPNPITQYCNTYFFIKKKKKKNPIQRKPNPRPRANQTHGEAQLAPVTTLAGTARSVACLPCLLVVDSSLIHPSSSLVTRASSQIVIERRSQIADRCSVAPVLAARPQGISLSLSLSLSEMKNMNVRILSAVAAPHTGQGVSRNTLT